MPTQERVRDLVAHVEKGRFLEAIDAFYSDSVVMQENSQPPTVGKPANLERERAFLAGVAQLDRYEATTFLVDGDLAVIHWIVDFLGTDGKQYHLDELALQTWQAEGDTERIVDERFFYDSASLVAKAVAEGSTAGSAT